MATLPDADGEHCSVMDCARLVKRMKRTADVDSVVLAEAAGIGLNTVRRLENGEETNPKVETLERIAEACGFELVVKVREL